MTVPEAPTSQRAGVFRRQPTGYRAFIPAGFPPLDLVLDDSEFLIALGKADRALARLDGAASVLPDVDLFIRMYVFQEATVSSQIEGTQATLADVVGAQADSPTPERRYAIQEIENYVKAMRHGLARLADLPISLRMVREIHNELMSGVRGGESGRTPGDFRTSQNWIGGSSPDNARYVPPPVEEMKQALQEWESAVHDHDRFPALVHIGLLHSQFETIHPFLDGNGRVGRLLITFLLTERQILAQPLLYLSIFFKAHQQEYYTRLQAVRDHGDWEGWLRFFIDGVSETARGATSTVQSILTLRERDRQLISTLGRRASNAYKLHDRLFSFPIVTSKNVEEIVEVSQPTADQILRDLEDLGILVEWTGRQRGKSWLYSEYFQLFAGDEVTRVGEVEDAARPD